MFGNLQLRDGQVEFRWKRWRNKKRQEVSCCLMVLLSGMVLLGGGGIAEAGPTGGQITGGAGSINYGGATTTINQKSQVITINWQTFSTARNETVDFNQPGSSSLAINYVVGGVPSVLQGALNADGRVYILNSAGITFTGTSHVNVGALLATTAMTIDGDPTKKIDVKGSGSGQVINQGSIQVSNGGFAILAAPYVENTGFIKADLGTIALAGTNKFTLDLRGDGLINFVVPPEAVEKIKSDGTRVGVNNTGTLQARSGQVLISASVATQVVNAAVNMSGVVDASAFAPNGKGGSVLITSEGDINLTGQVNAAGAGSGAGGQIITKAVGADNVGANAALTAAGGADAVNQGGQIEVSGLHVLLSGNIDPGAGGTLIVDPAVFTIRNGSFGGGPDFIGEKKLEKTLQNGVSFVASAANQVIMQDLSDNVLQGGGGNLTLTAGNAIVFKGTNDKIVTGSGAITMTAGAGGIGVVGGAGHTVALISGAPGLDHAGNIVLTATAGGNINVKNVTMKASGSGNQTALFSANAAGNFTAAGPIDVEAVAKGAGAQTANAQIDITAHDTLTLHGLKVFASASEQGGGGNLAALAGADLTARVLNDQGNASAQAVMGGHSGLRFNALANLTVDATDALRISGRTMVAASGDIHSVSFAKANALADLNGGDINIGELDVQASGLANQVGSDLVHATANLAGDQVIIGGNAAVTAFGAAPKAGYVLAVENLDITGNAVNIGGDATARATANNANLGKSASASANLFVTVTHAGSLGTFLHGNASVGGDLTVNALALNGGGSADADVRANLQVNARGIDVGGDVVVTANGQTLHVAGNQSSTPHATALANLTAGAGDLLIDGRFFVSAIASSQNRDSVVAKAKANMTAGGSVNIHGLVSVLANAVTDATHFFANRNGLGPPVGALASAGLVVNAGSDADLGNVVVHANGIDHGNMQADAFANAVIIAHGDIDANSFDVAAIADQTNALGNFTVNGSALAGLTLNASHGNVAAGDISVLASALDHGAGAGFASALLNAVAHGVTGGADITLGAIDLTAEASNWGGGRTIAPAILSLNATGDIHAGNVALVALANDHGANSACAAAVADFITPHGAVVIGSLGGKASAINAGGGIAGAVTDFDMNSGNIEIDGNVNLAANAHGLAGNGALAVATLDMAHDAGVLVKGDISIAAHGTNLGGGLVNAQASASFGGAGAVNLQDITIDAVALNKGNGAGAKANAILDANAGVSRAIHTINLQADASSHGVGGASARAVGSIAGNAVSISGDVTLAAEADNLTGNGALAVGSLDLSNVANVQVLGDISILAHGTNLGGGLVNAQGIADFTGVNALNLHDLTVDAVALNKGNGAGAKANALFSASDGVSRAIHTINLQADASSHGVGAASARALGSVGGNAVSISGGVTLAAEADNLAGNGALAVGSLDLSNVANVQVLGDISILAHGTNLGGGLVNAQANADFTGVDTLKLHDVTMDAVALNKGNGAGAKANAILSASGGLSLSLHNLNLHADASSNGVGGASAQAVGFAREKAVSISGNVTANAVAVTGIHALRNADAFAAIGLDASSGNVTAGLLDAEALASDGGAGNARGHTVIDVSASGGGSVKIGGLNGNTKANDLGAGAATALADARLTGTAVGITGNATLAANALNKGAPAANHLGANASATLVFSGSCDCGAVDVNVGGNLSVTAHATNPGSGQVKSRGGLGVNGSGSLSAHDITIDVAALNTGHGSGIAQATALLDPDPGVNISLHGINLQADASSQGVGGANAIAQGLLAGHNINISGTASANAKAVTGTHALAGAHATASFNFAALTGNVAIDNIGADALASDHGAGSALANRRISLSASAGGGHVTVGSMAGKANAFDAGAGGARALATTLIIAPTVRVGGSLSVVASALNLDGHGAGNMGASGDAELTFGGNGANVQVTGDIRVSGGASNSGSGQVNAHARFNFAGVDTLALRGVTITDVAFNGSDGSGAVTAQAVFSAGADINLSLDALSLGAFAVDRAGNGALASARGQITQPTVTLASGVFARANAFNGSGGAGNAQAVTNLALNATAGGVTVDTIRGRASARDSGAGNAVASQLVNVHVANPLTDAVTIGSLIGTAVATNFGAGQAKALSDVTLDPPGDIRLGNVGVFASATNVSGNGVGNIAASANADLTFAGARNITVTGAMDIEAFASNSGSGQIVAKSNVDFGVANNINLGGVRITASALNAGGSGVTALARFVETNANVHLNIGAGGLDVEALASSLGGGGASANALVDIVQNNLAVLGDITVAATASNGPGGEGDALAVANLHLAGVDGAVAVGGHIGVFAAASDKGSGQAIATALTGISASAGEGAAGFVAIGSLTDRADALNGGGGAALANAVAAMDAHNGTIVVGGSASAVAHAQNLPGTGGSGLVASADAQLNFSHAINVAVLDVAGAEAVAINSGSGAGAVNAHAAIGFDSTVRNIALGGVAVAVEASNLAVGNGGPGARATASFVMNNTAVNLVIGTHGVDVVAAAVTNDGGVAVANALVDIAQENLLILGDVIVTAVVLNGSAGEGIGNDAQATATLRLSATSGDASVLGQTLVEAVAHDVTAGNAIATALVGIVASAGEGETGGHVALDSLFTVASADDQGAGSARANAEARVNAPVITIGSDVGVVALAHGAGAGGNVNRGASANADLYFGSSGTNSGVVTVLGDIAVVAHGVNDGSGRVNAEAEFSFADIRTLNLHDVTIDVAALNRGNGTGGAEATAGFGLGSSINLSLHSLNLQAAASSHAGGGAVAIATADIIQPRLSITGDITLGANAFKGAGGSAGEGVALALLRLVASSGSVTVGGHIDVGAVAQDAGSRNAIAAALVGIQASAGEGHPANVTLGSLAVHANALNSGAGNANAIALANIDPPATVHILGNASVNASALNRGAGSDDETAASANAQLHFTNFATVTVDGNAAVGAHATNFGLGGVNANGNIDFGGAGNINLGGVQIDVSALNEGSAAGGPGANALAVFQEFNAAVNLTIGSGGINFQALASSHRGGGAFAVASALIIQDDIAVHGGIAVKANAFNGAGGVGNALGFTDVILEAKSGDVTVDGAIDVEGLASDQGAGNASAGALTVIIANAGPTGGITLGSLTMKADAVDFGGGVARAHAHAALNSGNHGPIDHIQVLGDLAVNATADNHTGFGCDNIGASADAGVILFNAHNFEVGGLVSVGARGTNDGAGLVNANAQLAFGIASNIDLGGVQIDVEARRLGVTGAGPGANATASFVMNDPAVNLSIGALGLNVQALASSAGGQGALANALVDITQDNLAIAGKTTVGANAFNGAGGVGNARAVGNLVLHATTGDIAVGSLGVSAVAVDSGAGNAVASGLVNAFANGDGKITARMITDRARASNAGAGYAQSLALTHLDAGGTIHIGGAGVVATANKAAGAQGHGIGASANAALVVDHTTKLTVDHTVSITANGVNLGASGVKAHGAIDFGSAQTINLGGVAIDVSARNLATGDNGSGAKASAVLIQNNAAVHMNIGGSGLDVIAFASSQGRDGASANALVDIDQAGISITGDILVGAQALGGRNMARQTKAHANLTLDAGAGGIVLGGDVDVNATASSRGIHGALASALADLTGGNVSVVGDVAIGAVASSHAAGNGALSPSVKANAQLSVDAGGSATFRNSVAITAQERGNRTLTGSAIAHGDIHANRNVNLRGDVLVQANALGGVAAANVVALASLDVAAGQTLNLVNKADLTVNAHAVSSGTKAVTALALAHLEGNAIREQVSNGQGDVSVTASALGLGHNIDDAIAVASFTADAQVGGILFQHDIDVHAKAVDPGAGRMLALGYADLQANSGITVGGNIALTGDLTGNGISDGTLNLSNIAHVVQLYQRFGSASLYIDAQHGGVNLGGVSVLANAKMTGTGTPHGNHGIGSLGSGGAWADAHILAGTGDLNLHGPVHVGANATDAAHGGSPIARAHLVASAGDNLAAGDITINAQLSAPNVRNAFALALGTLDAGGTQLAISGHVGLNAQLNAGTGVTGNVGAVANLVADARDGQVSIAQGLGLNANAVDLSSKGAALAYANADVQGDLGVSVAGQTAINADLTTKTRGGGQADINLGDHNMETMNYGWAFAGLTIDPQSDIKTGAITVDADADLLATAGPYSGGAQAFLNMNASAGAVVIGGPLVVTGDVVSQGKQGGNVSGIASAIIDGQAGVSLGNATVLGSASAQGAGVGQNANALASLEIDAATGNIVTKSLTVDAEAHALGTAGVHSGAARGLLNIDAAGGAVAVGGPLAVTGNIVAKGKSGGNISGIGSAVVDGQKGISLGNATVLGSAAAQGTGLGQNANALASLKIAAATGSIVTKSLTVDGEADLLGTAGVHTGAARGLLNVNAANGAVTIGGPLAVTGDVASKGKFGGNLTGIGSAVVDGQKGVSLGNATVLGSAAAQGTGIGQNANALASLKIDAETGNITAKSLTVNADADLHGTAGVHTGVARAGLNVNAANGAVTIGGPLLVTGDVVSAGKFGGNASGIGSAIIHGGDGVTLGNATVLGSASAVGGGLGQNANALASLKIKAETGNITAKSLTVVADAIDLGSGGQGVVTAKALSSLDAVTGNVTITGDKTLALAQAPHAISHATASADIVLHAGHDLAVTGGGLLAQAEALASFAQAPDKAEALIDVTAGSDIFLGGNVTALAVAIGSHSGQSATANIFVHAGTGGFGHLALIGNLSAIAVADPVNDHALASVTLIANQMLIIGANPIASAVAGGKSAFRKAHRTTGSKRNGASGTTAVARINITTDPGGLIVINDSSTGVIPSFSNPNADALQAMPIYDQTFPSGSLMAIPLSVDGKPCGALGGPGAAKGNAACHQAPINISNVVDGP